MNFERLDVYRCAIEFVSLAAKITESCKKGNGGLMDQLRRASSSIPLNIGEASGKVGIADRRRYFANARGSAMECHAILDVIAALGICSDMSNIDAGKHLLARIVGMLTRLCR